MVIAKLALHHFRSFSSGVFELASGQAGTGLVTAESSTAPTSAPTTIIVGPNASGKTSIIEAVNLLATAESFRATKIEEMIEFDQELARIKGAVLVPADDSGKPAESGVEQERSTSQATPNNHERLELEVLLTRGLVQGRPAQRRLYSVNNVRRQKKTFTGQLLTVVFRPEDMRLVEGSPGRRRDFLDQPLCLVDRDYARSLKTYSQALVRRNKLLWQISEHGVPRTALTYWDQTLLKHGRLVQQARRRLLTALNGVSFSRTDRLRDNAATGALTFRASYQPSIISAERQDQYRDRAIAAKHSLIGPQKDDFSITIDDPRTGPEPVDVAAYGSRGQQRLAVLWLKLGELAFVRERTNHRPVLLLDDILSELDDCGRQLVLAELGKRQTIITTTDQELTNQVVADHGAKRVRLE